jgi:two-component system chemotaxis response regulator CheY
MGTMQLNMNMRILVVDDSSTMQRIIKNDLKELGFTNVITADDGKSALEVIRRDAIELVLSDHRMPGMTGLELLSLVRNHPDYKCLPFIMITAEAFRENVLEAIKLGVSNYVVKPFSVEQLREKIEKVCGAVC